MTRHIRIAILLLSALLLIGNVSCGGDTPRASYSQSAANVIAQSQPPADPAISFDQPTASPLPQSSSENSASALANVPDRAAQAVLPQSSRNSSGATTLADLPDRAERAALRSSPEKPVLAQIPTFPLDGYDLFVHAPPNPEKRGQIQVIVALHGMGAQGATFARNLLQEADRDGWLLLAPTIPYRSHLDLDQLVEDDVRFSQMLAATLDALPARLGAKIKPRVYLWGFSRGAQLAHRFAYFYPERVDTVVALSAGTYTLPNEMLDKGGSPRALVLPFGVYDLKKYANHPLEVDKLKQVRFYVAVGEKDNRPSDVPRSFDEYSGKTRVERAAAFVGALRKLGVPAQFVIVPGAEHELTAEMCDGATKFLRDKSSASSH
jgi:pimeloyl-ACP methyl ester carboxylesterase